jgi:hypothetical protein
MTRKLPATRAGRPPEAEDGDSVEDPRLRQILRRPDGYYWQALDGRQEFGPFDSLEEALADMEAVDEEEPEPGESLQEAEDEIGISDWIDPETGEPAEGHSPPRLDEE